MNFNSKLLIVAALVAGTATPAAAEVVLYANKPSNFSFTTPTAMVPLKPNGKTLLPFVFKQNVRGFKAITFSAECAVNAPDGNHSAWVDLDILIDGVAVPPTQTTSDAFCGANGTLGFDGWGTHSITVVKKLAPGPHTVEVLARLNGGATGGWISDTALVVFD